MSYICKFTYQSILWRFNFTGFIFLAILLSQILFFVLPTKAGELSNQYCPVTTSELAEEQFSVEYQDQQIFFCCNKCKKDFLSNPETYLANLESKVPGMEQTESSHDHDEGAHEHGGKVTEAVADDHAENTTASHDHTTDHEQSSSIVGFVGKFHPMFTHFPIALVLSALLFMILAVALDNQTMNYVSVYSMYLAAFTGIGTVVLGLAAGSAASYPTFLIEYFSWHRYLGIATGIITILTAYIGWISLQRPSRGTVGAYRILLIINAIIVGLTGHFGAILVFGPDHFKF